MSRMNGATNGNSGDAVMSESVEPSEVSFTDRAICWTILHHLQHTEEKSKISLEEIEGLEKHVGNAIWPADLNIVQTAIEAHYPGLVHKVSQSRWEVGAIIKLFNVKETNV